MQRPGANGQMEYPTTPTSDASERKGTNIQDVELRERYKKKVILVLFLYSRIKTVISISL
jgi:hypothetical protein